MTYQTKKSKNQLLITIAIVVMAILFCFADNVMAQNVKRGADGNFTAISKSNTGSENAKPTSYTYTDTKGEVYPVYESKNGKNFTLKTSKKSGKQYRSYLKER